MKTTAVKAFEQVLQSAEKICNDKVQYFPVAASPGDACRQGDIYLVLLKQVPPGAKPIPVQLQLAPGNTQGSRHILSHGNVEMFEKANPTPLDGPIFRTATEVEVTHPEHGNVVLPPGTYGVTYQKSHADELKRRLD